MKKLDAGPRGAGRGKLRSRIRPRSGPARHRDERGRIRSSSAPGVHQPAELRLEAMYFSDRCRHSAGVPHFRTSGPAASAASTLLPRHLRLSAGVENLSPAGVASLGERRSARRGSHLRQNPWGRLEMSRWLRKRRPEADRRSPQDASDPSVAEDDCRRGRRDRGFFEAAAEEAKVAQPTEGTERRPREATPGLSCLSVLPVALWSEMLFNKAGSWRRARKVARAQCIHPIAIGKRQPGHHGDARGGGAVTEGKKSTCAVVEARVQQILGRPSRRTQGDNAVEGWSGNSFGRRGARWRDAAARHRGSPGAGPFSLRLRTGPLGPSPPTLRHEGSCSAEAASPDRRSSRNGSGPDERG